MLEFCDKDLIFAAIHSIFAAVNTIYILNNKDKDILYN